MFNRAEIVDKNFSRFVREGKFPERRSFTKLSDTSLLPHEVIDLFETQVMSRHLDLIARDLKNRNLCYYTIGSSGHEGNAVLGKIFRTTDMAFLHYRSGAFMIQRMKQVAGSTPLFDLMLSFTAALEEPIAGGRHKVFGSRPLFVPPQTSTIASHLPKAVGAALSIPRAKDLNLKTELPEDAVIYCSFGDASANHASALSAFNTAAYISHQKFPLPLVFVCEDNGIGISVRTPKGWIEASYQNRPGLSYLSCDGLNIFDLYEKGVEAAQLARLKKKPVFLHVKLVRLMGHAGSDMETSYHTLSQIDEIEFNDPLLHSASRLIEEGIASSEDILSIYERTRERVRAVAEEALTRPQLESPEVVRQTITACTSPRKAPPFPKASERQKVFEKEWEKLSQPQHMAKLINYGLHDLLLQYPSTLVFGEDVAQKGGVYNVTDGLYRRFGPRRVFNSPLDETSILGTAIGLAHNGFVPIPEIQFLAYVHNAEDQIRGEASTLAFFSKGQFTNPMVVRIAGLAYQKGFGGHFHNDNSLAVFRDIPGLIVAVPSNGRDAVMMMRRCVRAAYEEGRVCVFVEPIALYMTRDLHAEGDKQWCFTYPQPKEDVSQGEGAQDSEHEIELGSIGVHLEESIGKPKDRLTILTYGNGVYYSRQAARQLAEHDRVETKIVDLRWLAPLNWDAVLAEVSSENPILFVEECRKTGSFSEQIISGIVERLMGSSLPPLSVVAADDCFIPLGRAAAAGLPKMPEILKAARELLSQTGSGKASRGEKTHRGER